MKIFTRTLALVAGIAILPLTGTQSVEAGSKDRASTHRDKTTRTHVRAPAKRTHSMSKRWHDMMSRMKRTTTRKTHVRAPATKTRTKKSR